MPRNPGGHSPCQTCRHCRRCKITRPRGLCDTCYRQVKDQYPSTSKYARKGVGHGGQPRPLPEPTAALTGTPEKLAELVRRAELGLELWHPMDGYPANLPCRAVQACT